jgi:VanZ family protein
VDALFWGATAFWAAVTVCWTLRPTPPEADSVRQADKLLHGLAYAVMVLLLALVADRRPGRGSGPLPHSAAWLTIMVVAAGGTLELLQHVTGRDVELLDWIAGCVGASIGLAGWALINRLSGTRPSTPRVRSDRR